MSDSHPAEFYENFAIVVRFNDGFEPEEDQSVDDALHDEIARLVHTPDVWELEDWAPDRIDLVSHQYAVDALDATEWAYSDWNKGSIAWIKVYNSDTERQVASGKTFSEVIKKLEDRRDTSDY